jgi:hypothetical protein
VTTPIARVLAASLVLLAFSLDARPLPAVALQGGVSKTERPYPCQGDVEQVRHLQQLAESTAAGMGPDLPAPLRGKLSASGGKLKAAEAEVSAMGDAPAEAVIGLFRVPDGWLAVTSLRPSWSVDVDAWMVGKRALELLLDFSRCEAPGQPSGR